jgi:hypothetical protein
MTSLDVSNNSLGTLVLPVGWKTDKSASSWDSREWIYKHSDGREQKGHPGKPEGLIALVSAIKDMDMGALSIANVMGNSIGKKMLSKLQEIMRSKPNLISLCGIADGATEADLSGFGMDADDAIILASELPDKGALTKLDISRNDIGPSDIGPLLLLCAAGGIELAK